MTEPCCEMMRAQVELTCPVHSELRDCSDSLIARSTTGYGLRVHDGGSSTIQIDFCPWCGASLEGR